MTTTSTKPEALLWIDMETTGPDRTTAQILEIGMACTDSTATQDYGAFHAIVKPDILDISRITPWAWEHHTANGLIAEVRAASTRQNGPAAVGNAAEEYLESLEQRFQLVPTHQRRLRPRIPRTPRHRHQPAQPPQTRSTTIRRLVAILGGPDPYTSHHEGRTASRTASPETSTTTATTSKPSNSRTAANETERRSRTMDGLAAFILLTAVFIAWLGGDHDGPAGPRK